MDRSIVYPGAVPADTDFLTQNRNTMIALGQLADTILGDGPVLDGFGCVPGTGLTVTIPPGAIFNKTAVDATPYGSLAADTTYETVKQGIAPNTTTLTCPAPTTAGQSIAYLVQIAQQDVDGTPVVLPFYDSANPAVPYSGPLNAGTPSNTIRASIANVEIKAGAAAATGSQVTPAPDAGFTGAYVVTIAYGETSVAADNIALYPGAIFITETLQQKIGIVEAQAGSANYAVDTSSTVNLIIANLSPTPPKLAAGMIARVKVANTNTAAATLTLNGLGNAPVLRNGSGLIPGDLIAGAVYEFLFDGTAWQLPNTSATFRQSGTIPAGGANGPYALVFPTPFPNTCQGVVVTPIVPTPAGVDTATLAGQPSRTGVTINRMNYSNGAVSQSNWSAIWEAWGY